MKLKIVTGIMLTLLMASMVIVLAGKASPISIIAQAKSTTTVYLDPPTINGTVIGEEFTININIVNAYEIHGWQAGMIFNPDLLECTGFFEGEFLKIVGPTLWVKGTINNTAGIITIHGCALLGNLNASGDGRLAYLTFKVKAPGVSDLHLHDVKVIKLMNYVPIEVPTYIIDVYTVVLDTTAHTVVTVSNSTGITAAYHSGFYDHAFNPALKELSFNVTGPHPGFSNVTIPKTLLWGDFSVIIDGISASRTVTENATHTSIYFTYSLGIHKIQIVGAHAPISIYTDKDTYSAGQTMHVGLGIHNPLDRPITVCIAIWLERPVGPIIVMLHAHAVTLSAGFTYSNPDFMSFVLPAIPSGTYTWHAAFLKPTTHKILIKDTAEWQFS